MKRILILSPWYVTSRSIGGTERFIMDLAEQLIKENYFVDVIMLSGKSYQKNKVNYISLKLLGDTIIDEYILEKMLGGWNNIASYDMLSKMLEEKIDGSIYENIVLNSTIFLHCFRDCKRVFIMHSNESELGVTKGKKEIDFILEMMKQENKKTRIKFVVPSKSYFLHWEKQLGGNVFTIPHAIKIQRIITKKDLNELLKKYSLNSQKIRVLLPNRLEPKQKRPLFCLQSLKDLTIAQKNKFQIIITGFDLQYERYIEKLRIFAKNNSIDLQLVKFESMKEAYACANILCIPSKFETFGFSALESLATGKPTILTRIPTFCEIGKDCKNAIFFVTQEELKAAFLDILNKEIQIYDNKALLSKYEMKKWISEYIKLFRLS